MFNNKSIVKPLCFGLIFSIIVTFIFMCIFAFMATNFDFSEDMLLILSLVSMTLGSMFGGFVAGKINKEKGFIIGAINGFVLFLIITLISLIFNQNSITIVTLIKLVTLVLSSMIGGVIGVNTTHKRHF